MGWAHVATIIQADRQMEGVSKPMPDQSVKLYVNTDGAAEPNPGPSGIGVVVRDEDGRVLTEAWKAIGFGTNNRAEYFAAAQGLRLAADHGATEVVLRTDSQLVVEQLSGRGRSRTRPSASTPPKSVPSSPARGSRSPSSTFLGTRTPTRIGWRTRPSGWRGTPCRCERWPGMDDPGAEGILCASARSATASRAGGSLRRTGPIYSTEAGLPPAPSPPMSLGRLTGSPDNLTG